jgi:Glycosyl hydrolases family 2, TIM barrel domain
MVAVLLLVVCSVNPLPGMHEDEEPICQYPADRCCLAACLGLRRRDAQILKTELNCNMVRCSHYPQSPHFLDACDELGIMVWEEPPGWGHMGGTVFRARVLDDVRDMVVRDRNRPSVIVWGTGSTRRATTPGCTRRPARSPTSATGPGRPPARWCPSQALWRPAARGHQRLPRGSFTPGVSPVWKLVTSGGSTGRPKLIAATAPALFENVGGLGALVRMPPDGCVLVTGPVSHNGASGRTNRPPPGYPANRLSAPTRLRVTAPPGSWSPPAACQPPRGPPGPGPPSSR